MKVKTNLSAGFLGKLFGGDNKSVYFSHAKRNPAYRDYKRRPSC